MDGGDYVPLRAAVQTLFVQKYMCANIATKNIGGVVHRARPQGRRQGAVHAGSGRRAAQGARLHRRQRAQVRRAYALPPEMLNKLQDDKMWSWENNPFEPGRRFEFPLTDWVEAMQTGVLFNLMNPILQSRVVESQYKSDDAFKLSELYSTLTKSIWTSRRHAEGPHGDVGPQPAADVHRHADPAGRAAASGDAAGRGGALAVEPDAHPRRRRRRHSRRKGLDDETNAHLMETIARIDRALTASRETNF